MPSLPLEPLLSGSTEEREAAAARILTAAAESPERLEGSVSRLAAAIEDDHAPVRCDAAAALAAVAEANPTGVGPVAETLVDALADEEQPVRRGAAKAVADLAVARPRRLLFGTERVVGALTDAEPVRRESARTVAALAPRYPEVLSAHRESLLQSLLDDYHPVTAAILRALVPVERAYPGTLDAADQRLRLLLTAEAPAVRQAACRAVAASGPSWMRSELRERCRTEHHPVVRETARAALTAADAAAQPATTPDGSATDLFETVTVGTWMAVDVGTAERPLVGRVSTVTHDESEGDAETRRARGLAREDFGSRDDWLAAPRIRPSGERRAVHLHNPFAEYGVTLLPAAGDVGVEFTDPHGERSTVHQPTGIRAVSPDRARLLAAAPGDELAFELEGAEHAIRVTTAGEVDGTYRVGGGNGERGYEISFRPLATEPMMAVFAAGRAFRAENVQLRPRD